MMDGFVADEVGRKHTYNGVPVPSVTQIIEILKDFSKINPEDLRIAQEYGTIGHNYLYLYDKGTLRMETVDPKMLPAIENWKEMKAARGWTIPILSEKRYYSKRYRYTGRLDGLYKSEDLYTLLDFKFGDDEYTDLQTAANLNLVRENYAMIKAERLMVHFDINGKIRSESFPMSDFKADFNDFLCCARVFQLKKR